MGRGEFSRISIKVLLLTLVISIWGISSSWGLIYIDINSPSGVRIPVAVPALLGEDPLGNRYSMAIAKALASDLEISAVFKVINRNAYLETISKDSFVDGGISFSDWKMIGADSLVVGKVSGEGKKLFVEFILYDVSTGKKITLKKYVGPESRYEMIAHKFANEILYRYTGVYGVFDTEIAFSARKRKGKELFIVDFTGKKLRQITSNGSINMFPRWSPDGYKIAYLSYRRGKPYVFMRDFIKGSERLLLKRGGFKSPGSFSPEGGSLYLSLSRRGNTDIYRMDLSGRRLFRVISHYGIDVSPSLSPGGDKIAFVSDRSGYPQVYVKDLRGGRETRVSYAGYYSTSPSWSPRGDQIAFASMSEGKFSIYSVSYDGSKLKEIVSADGNCEDPSFSPDGRYIVYIYRKKGYSEARIVNVTGLGDRLLIKGLKDVSSPSWSPRR
jgi:TolB protein